MSQIQQVEIVRTPPSGSESIPLIVAGVIDLLLKSLVVWLFVATVMPTFGFTYWTVLLFTITVRTLIQPHPMGKYLPKRGK